MLPFLPEEKSNQAILESFTKNEGVFSWPKRRQADILAARLLQLDPLAHHLGDRHPSLDVLQE